MLMVMCLRKFGIYKRKVAPSCLKATQTIDVLIVLPKKVFSDVRSDIHLIPSNIVSTRQSFLSDLKRNLVNFANWSVG